MLPSLFVSHGAPTLALQDAPARRFLQQLGASQPRPRAIVVASAHWETAEPRLGAAPHPETIHDFGRFDDALFAMRYPAPGDAALAARAAALLGEAGVAARLDPSRGLDHGVWVPLILMYPEADIPVIPLAIQPDAGPEHHMRLGQALASVRAERVLVLGSGSFTHDLSRIRFREPPAGTPADAPADVEEFAAWFDAALAEGRKDDLLAYRSRAPHAAENHPTEEHLLPLYVALGAAGGTARAERLHSSSTFGVLRMDAYAFH